MKIALTIPTGRPQVTKVVRAFIENAELHGHNVRDFSVYLSIDRGYQNTSKNDFKLDVETEKKVNKVEYIFEEERAKLGKRIVEVCKSEPKITEQLFAGRGYSKQRNAALFKAVFDGNDIAICIDDDEAPFAPIKKDNGWVEWKNLDFFGPHFNELIKDADITRGPYLGYLSPIPSDFEKDIPEEIRKKLGEALQFGNEVITQHSFLNLMNKIKYLSKGDLTNSTRPFVVKECSTGKNILSGNMGINLDSVRKGKIPIFYNPPEARGEDAIFALQLKSIVVKEVPSYIFHDPFGMYSNIFEGEFPEYLAPIPVTDATKRRFSNALIGWLKYAPILINMTSDKDKDGRIDEMLSRIDDPTKWLAKMFDCKELGSCFDVLKEYSANVEIHYENLLQAQTEWRNKIVPGIVRGRPLYNE